MCFLGRGCSLSVSQENFKIIHRIDNSSEYWVLECLGLAISRQVGFVF